MVHDTKSFWTMAPQPTHKQLCVGASCTIKLRFLHPKYHVKDKIPNQTASQQLTGLIVQSKAEKVIYKVNKECIVFQHEDFGGQLIWALQHYVQVNIQGQRSLFLKKKPRSHLLLLGRARINTMCTHKALQMLKMHPTPSLTMLKSFLLSFRTCWTGGGANLDNDDICQCFDQKAALLAQIYKG